MKLRILAACCVLALVGADKPEEKKADELEGTWTAVAWERNGEALPTKLFGKDYMFTFQPGGKVVHQFGTAKPACTYKSDPTKSPKTLDITYEEGDDKGQTVHYLYVIEGDTLKLCKGLDSDSPRPTEISSKKGSKQSVYTLKREKK